MKIRPPYQIGARSQPAPSCKVSLVLTPKSRAFIRQHAHLIPLVLDFHAAKLEAHSGASQLRLCLSLVDELKRLQPNYADQPDSTALDIALVFHLHQRFIREMSVLGSTNQATGFVELRK